VAEGNGSGPAVWSAEQFRQLAPKLVTLPSGAVVRVRECTAVDLALSGAIPEPLSFHVVRETTTMEREAGSITERGHIRLELAQAIHAVVCAYVTEPVIWPDDDETAPAGALRISEVPWADRMFLFNLACGQVEAGLHRFPGEPPGGLAPSPAGADLREATVGDAGDGAGELGGLQPGQRGARAGGPRGGGR